MPLTTKERKSLGAASLEQLVSYTRDSSLQAYGKDSRFMLDEFSRRLEVPIDAVAIVVIRDNQTKAENTLTAYLWCTAGKVEKMRAYPTRKWNMTCHSNTFTLREQDDADFNNFLKDTFSKSILISPRDCTILDGKGTSQWSHEPMYALLGSPVTVNIGKVVAGFIELRPHDAPERIYLHGEWDQQYRSLFGGNLQKQPVSEASLEFPTRHSILAFRVGVPNGKLRYLLYSVADQQPIKVTFADSKETDAILAHLKETQRRLAHPLIEPSAGLKKLLPGSPGTLRKKPCAD